MSSIVTNGQIKVTNLWKREGLFYYSIVQVFNGNLKLIGTVTRRLDFVSYHLIKSNGFMAKKF